jgi:phosphoribosylaminoimidazole (AIR) synthetase
MFRAFNMGIGMILVVDKLNCDKIKSILEPTSQVYEVGKVVSGKKEVIIQ